MNTCPSAAGAKSWNSMAYSPRTGYVYAPINEVCNDLRSESTEANEGRFHANGGFTFKLPPDRNDIQSHRMPGTQSRASASGACRIDMYCWLRCWRPRAIWFSPAILKAISSLGRAHREKLWSYQTGAGNRGSAVSYSVAGGNTSRHRRAGSKPSPARSCALFPEQNWRTGSTLIVFALPETSK